MSSSAEKQAPLSLPSNDPEAVQATTASLAADGSHTIKFDQLGPLVTLSRVPNWQDMTDVEKERTMRVLNKRNQKRLQALREEAS
ncbi:fungal specific transcription [Malassezia pachydermatis]|uniref:Fungal specific transcription n=1 Tax=Malassezia pachydermatis TaxID=77020 RepID=A0A0M8MQR1_9BASI|nr:fungal specific transcription [Malassezia pachydermatis]KOS16438.1 fungal specific transcription [Malassezia pachydermatis]